MRNAPAFPPSHEKQQALQQSMTPSPQAEHLGNNPLVDRLKIIVNAQPLSNDLIEEHRLISDVQDSPSPSEFVDYDPVNSFWPHQSENKSVMGASDTVEAPVNTLDDVVIRYDNPVDREHIRPSPHHKTKKQFLTESEYDILKKRETSLDYAEASTNIYGLKHMGSEPIKSRTEQIFTWIITMCIGILVGAVGICLRLINTNVSKEKWDIVYQYLAEQRYWAAWGSFIGLSLCFAVPSAVIVIFIAPWVGSSGIPDVKTYLNGSNVPRGFAFRTLTLKTASTTLTVLGPIPSGLQGPMIHIGAIIAGWFSQHFRRVVKRIFCCARADQETRDEQDRPQYPHPIPAVTFAPGYRTVVDAAFAGAEIECHSSINDRYFNLPKIDQRATRYVPLPAEQLPVQPVPGISASVPGINVTPPDIDVLPANVHPLNPTTLSSSPLHQRDTMTQQNTLTPPNAVEPTQITSAPPIIDGNPINLDGNLDGNPVGSLDGDLVDNLAINPGVVTAHTGALQVIRKSTLEPILIQSLPTVSNESDPSVPQPSSITSASSLSVAIISPIEPSNILTGTVNSVLPSNLASVSIVASQCVNGESSSDVSEKARNSHSTESLYPSITGAEHQKSDDKIALSLESQIPEKNHSQVSSAASCTSVSSSSLTNPPFTSPINAPPIPPSITRPRRDSNATDFDSHTSLTSNESLPTRARASRGMSMQLDRLYPAVDATVDGDIVPVTSTGRAALLEQAGMVIPSNSTEQDVDPTATQHEFHKRARAPSDAEYSRALQRANQSYQSQTTDISKTVSDNEQIRLEISHETLTEEIEMVDVNGGPELNSQGPTHLNSPHPNSRNANLEGSPVPESFSPYYHSDNVNGLARLPISVDSEQKNRSCPRWLRNIVVPSLSTDADRRDFISIGCAAGMSASMGAPIGGVVYVLEEMGSYWSNTLALRLLTGSVLASVTAAFIGTAAARIRRTGEFLPEYYATFFVGRRPAAYRVEELPTFIIVGIACGIFGALFNTLAQHIIRFRAQVYGKTKLRYAVYTLLALVAWATILFVLPFGFECIKTAPDYAIALASSSGAPADVYSVVRAHCEPGYHNPMSTLTMSIFDSTARRLLARGLPHAFEPSVLAVWFIVLFFGIIIMFNVASTPGVVLPLIILGALAGRLIGSGFHLAFGHTDFSVSPSSVYFDPGVYATVGAAAMFSGTTRTTLSMSILILEITADLNLLLPILIGAFTAHIVSAALTDPYYEILIRLRRLPFINAHPICELNQLTARQLMAKPVVRLGCVETVSHILDVLESCIHNGFPVVLQPCAAQHAQRHHPGCAILTDPHVHGDDRMIYPISRSLIDDRDLPYGANSHIGFGCDNTYIGMVLRTHLLAIINRRVWRPDSKPFTPEDFERVLARAPPKISELRSRLMPEDLDASVDLVPWADNSAYVVPDSMIGFRVFSLFRQLNLRHLPVVDMSRRLVGMITRLELLEPVVKQLYNTLMQRQNEVIEHGGFGWREDWCQHRSALEQIRVARHTQRQILSNDADSIQEVFKKDKDV